MMKSKASLIAHDQVLRSIVQVRGIKVILDADLATPDGASTKVLVQAVKRNLTRFPDDFMFQLAVEEFANLRSQNVTSSSWGGRRTAPYAFTEQGVAMLSSVLRSPRAIAVNIEIMRAFVRLRQIAGEHRELARKLADLERRYDSNFQVVFDAIRTLINPETRPRKRIGYLEGSGPGAV
jgi:hypothetical protein